MQPMSLWKRTFHNGKANFIITLKLLIQLLMLNRVFNIKDASKCMENKQTNNPCLIPPVINNIINNMWKFTTDFLHVHSSP